MVSEQAFLLCLLTAQCLFITGKEMACFECGDCFIKAMVVGHFFVDVHKVRRMEMPMDKEREQEKEDMEHEANLFRYSNPRIGETFLHFPLCTLQGPAQSAKLKASICVASLCMESLKAFQSISSMEGSKLKQESNINSENALYDLVELVCEIPTDKGGGTNLAANLYAQADNRYSKVLTYDPDDMELFTNLGWISLTERITDTVEVVEAFNHAKEKIRNVANFILADINVCIALGELFNLQVNKEHHGALERLFNDKPGEIGQYV
eukprot:Gb_09723 [translate_table: standard]